VEVPGNLSALLAIFSRLLAACVTVPRCHLVAVAAEKEKDENERETRAQGSGIKRH
jgi:starvation-inducible outer membrane lipoprotein